MKNFNWRMTTVKRYLFASFLILVVSLALSGEVEEKMKRAEAALNGGEVGKALEIYREILRSLPDNLEALKKAALLSSWQKEYASSISYYEKVLSIDPGDRQSKINLADVYSWNSDYEHSIDIYRDILLKDPDNRDVRLKLARVLSWGKRYPESITEYEAILKKNPDDKEARLGLARVLSWKGDMKDSEAEFRKLKSADPDDVEVLVGLANVLSWQGKYPEAEAEYRKALEADSKNVDANTGLARVLLWQGEKREARRIARKLVEEVPQNEKAQSLLGDVRTSLRPHITTAYDWIDDSEDNTISIYRADFVFHPEPQTDMGVNLARYDLELHEASASVNSYGVTLASRLSRRNFFYARLGGERLEDMLGESKTYLVGALAYRYSHGEKLHWGIGVSRDTFKVTVETINNDLVVDSSHTDFSYTIAKPLRLYLRYERSDFSDGNDEDVDYDDPMDKNTRDDATFSVRYTVPLMKPSLTVSYRFRYLSFDENRDSGYFDPQRYVSNALNIELSGRTPNALFYYALSMDGGLQSFRFKNPDGTETRSGDDSFFGGGALFGINIAKRVALEFYGSKTDYALQVGTGYSSTTAGARLRFQF
ncbi:MAG: tetratricopeptide repeat protein [Acidobacteriota bacterium]